MLNIGISRIKDSNWLTIFFSFFTVGWGKAVSAQALRTKQPCQVFTLSIIGANNGISISVKTVWKNFRFLSSRMLWNTRISNSDFSTVAVCANRTNSSRDFDMYILRVLSSNAFKSIFTYQGISAFHWWLISGTCSFRYFIFDRI